MVVVKWRHCANGLLHLAVCVLRFYMYLFMSLTFWDLLFQKPSQEEVEKFKEYILEKFDDNSDGKISMCEVRTIQWLFLISKGFFLCFGLLGRRDGFHSYSRLRVRSLFLLFSSHLSSSCLLAHKTFTGSLHLS